MARRKKSSKKKVVVAIVALLLVAIILFGLYYYFCIYKGYSLSQLFGQEAQQEEPHNHEAAKEITANGTIQTDELSIHFLELGNKYAGDCTLIKVGDTEILIDAGSKKGSAGTIVPYVEQYCTDGILEYVIATHGHQDHIAAFVGTKDSPGIFESFECKTIIDFPKTDVTSQILQDYYEKREAEISAGAKHYTALQCWNETDGAKKSYQLTDNITMNILYNYYYENKAADENDYSVCMLLTQGDYNYLFTGDLEEDGESRLVDNNQLPKCKLFKGGHHGSKTSTTEKLLAVIQPEVICVCCCAGAPEYTTNPDNVFPTQDFVNRAGKYTELIFVTTLATDIDLANEKWNYTSMNGNIVVTSNGIQISVNCSKNNTVLKDTDWFKNNRTWPTSGATQ